MQDSSLSHHLVAVPVEQFCTLCALNPPHCETESHGSLAHPESLYLQKLVGAAQTAYPE